MLFIFKLYYYLKNHLLFNLIFFNIYYVIYSTTKICDIGFFPEFSNPKVITLSNNYKLMLTTTGIYSFIPTLNRIVYSYNFTEDQKVKSNEQTEIFRSQISQFSNETGGNEYVLCYINNYIYVLDNNGQFLFYEYLNLTINNLDSLSLICKDYNSINDFYTFSLIHNTDNVEDQGKRNLIIYTYSLFFFDENKGQISLFYNFSHYPTFYNKYNYSITSGGISCNAMAGESSNIIICFISVSLVNGVQQLLSLGIDPYSYELSNNGFLQEGEITFISSSLGSDRSSALVCFVNLREKGICYSYDINNMNFSENKILELNCTSENYVVNTFFSSQSGEFVFSCIQKNPIFFAKRIDQNFHVFNDDFFHESSFNCAYLLSYSIVYVKSYRAYVSIIQSNCEGGDGIRFFELSNLCKMTNIREAIFEEEGEGEGKEKERNNLTQEISHDIHFSITPSDDNQTSNEEYSKSDKNTLSTLFESDKKYHLSDLYIKDKPDNKEKLSDINIKTDKIKEIISDSNEGSTKISLSDRNSEKKNSDTNIEENLNSDIDISDYKTEYLSSKTYEKITNQIETFTNSEDYIVSKSDYRTNSMNEGITNSHIHTELLTQSYIKETIKLKTDGFEFTDEIIKKSEKCFCHKDLPYLLFPSLECTNSCDVSQLLNKACKVDCISDETFQDLVQNIKTVIKNDTFSDEEEIVIVGNNVICDITTTQMKHKYNNISYIDLGECEAKLKQKHKINYLLILKFDVKLDDNLPTSVEYEVYNPYTKEKLDLSICSNEKINIEVPKILDENSLVLYQNLSSFGYDVFNKNDPFYNEICTVYSSEDNTDVLLIDRRLSYYNENLLFCESGCEYSNYNLDRNTVTCKCEVKKNVSLDLNVIGFEKNNISSFFDIKTYMNIEVVKCFNLLFCKSGFINNYGSYILSFEILMFLIFMLLFYFKYKKNIIDLISQVYPKYNYNKISSPLKKNDSIVISKNSNQNNSNKYLLNKKEKPKSRKIKKDDKKEIKDKKGQKDDKKIYKKKYNKKNKDNLKRFKVKEKETNSKNRNLDSTYKIIKDIYSNYKSKANTLKFLENNIKVYKKNKIHQKKLNLNDEEINTLEYKEAIILDKRTFSQYYVSIIKKRSIILFTFVPQNDYNLIKMKICLFII